MSHLYEVLIRLRNRGIFPSGFIDVGAHFGETYNTIRSVFPEQRIVSFEANPNCESVLKQRGIEHHICLLGNETVEAVPFYINPDDRSSTGCSMYKEVSRYFERAETINIPMYRLDKIVPVEAKLNFLKMDVQGAELDVLDGAAGILSTIRWIYLEVSFVPCNENAPLFDKVYRSISDRGYHLIDICDPTYIDNRLIQTNILFER